MTKIMFTHLKKLLKLENKWMDNNRNDFYPLEKSDFLKKVKVTQFPIRKLFDHDDRHRHDNFS